MKRRFIPYVIGLLLILLVGMSMATHAVSSAQEPPVYVPPYQPPVIITPLPYIPPHQPSVITAPPIHIPPYQPPVIVTPPPLIRPVLVPTLPPVLQPQINLIERPSLHLLRQTLHMPLSPLRLPTPPHSPPPFSPQSTPTEGEKGGGLCGGVIILLVAVAALGWRHIRYRNGTGT